MKNGVLVCSCGRTCCETAMEQYALDEKCTFCQEERRSREPMKKPTCKTCDYFVHSGIEDDCEGDCRRRPPILKISDLSNGGVTLSSYFTVSALNDFCGEHQDFPKWQEFKNE